MKVLATLLLISLAACSTTYPNQKLIGEKFPEANGKNLDQKEWVLPNDFKGEPVILLIGYKQNTQFDIDRWLIGLDMTGTKAPIFEIPTIQGMFPRMFKESIDNGMRSGIPKDLWKIVITVYKDGAKIQKFTGNENPRNARAVLLDKEGIVRYFHDEGFSVGAMNELKATLKKLQESASNSKIGKSLTANKYSNIYFSRQPHINEYKDLKDQGFALVVNLRNPSEHNEAAENEVVTKLGMKYVNIPFDSSDVLDDNFINRVTAKVKKHRKAGKILIHCSSGNRAGLWAGGHFRKDHKYSKEKSIAIAKEFGITKPEILSKLQAYLKNN